MQLYCPACGYPTEHRLLYSKNGCDILQCAECRLGRAEAKSFDPSSYYTEGYFSAGQADGYADYRGAEGVLRREFARTVGFIRHRKPTGRLLDIGCAYGFFLQEARRYFEVAGIEISEEASRHARQQGLQVVTGVAEQATLARLGTFDVIVLLDVIEHLSTPYQTLSLCTQYLKPGGIIVITTGDFGSLYARLAGAQWRLMTPPQHLWYFTRASIARLAQRLDLRLESCEHPWKVVPVSLVLFQISRMAGIRPKGVPAASRLGVPLNLFDAMRVVLRRGIPA
jgi:SAM-dependent methyltransferase